ncbi:MAG: acyl-CoA dehydrogenase, partial [Casimicrobiaceae bacterium]
HDFTDNIIHLVLARLPDAPIGIKGISLFVVPKFIVNDDGAIGSRNDVRCVSLEHKLGIHASPTAVLAYGDKGGATGYLIGERNRGLEYMFIMMNLARFSVGMEGVGISERAYQRAATFARERIQGRSVGFPSDVANTTIIEHPDIRRMLMTMRAYTEAMRAVAYETAATLDVARHHPNDSIRAQQQSQAEFMVPVIKGWCTETAQQVTSLGLQIHGGMGYIEETGVAQYTRDVRITTIYEGTTSIQANDFVSRKTARDGGKAARGRIQEILITANELSASDATNLVGLGEALRDSADWLRESLEIVLERLVSSPREAFAVSVPYLELWGVVCGGWQMGRAALVASQKMATCTGEKTFLASKLATSRYYIEALLPRGGALVAEIRARGNTVFTLLAEHF